MGIGLGVLVLGFALLLVNLTNPVSNYVRGVGMVETQSPSAGSIIMIIGGLILAGIGFGRRVLSTMENR